MNKVLRELVFVLQRIDYPSSLEGYYQKRISCYNCENLLPLHMFYFNHRNSGRYQRYSECKKCTNYQNKERRKTKKSLLTQILHSCTRSAKIRKEKGRLSCGICTLTKGDILSTRDRQNNKCAISGVDMEW